MNYKLIFLLCFIVVITNTPASCRNGNEASSYQSPTNSRRSTISRTPTKSPLSGNKKTLQQRLNKTVSLNEDCLTRAFSNLEKKLIPGQAGNSNVVFNKISITQIMNSIQLGIRHLMKDLTLESNRNLLMSDFATVEAIAFPSQGGEGIDPTPKHDLPAFTFKWYAPVIFHYFRGLYNIRPDAYMESFCSNPPKKIGNSGASGALFFKTYDDKYIMKSLQIKESAFLLKLLPGYHLNFNQNPSTLLPKFFGFYRYSSNQIHVSAKYTNRKIRNVRLVAMNNLIPTDVEIHEKYDLKGSTHKRKASEEELKKSKPTLKDLDFRAKHPDGIFLELKVYEQLVATIKRDCRVLQSFKIMDYSLLMGVHYVSPDEKANKDSTIGRIIYAKGQERNNFLSKGVVPAKTKNDEDIILYVGIIDILQSYRWQKKLEHFIKSQGTDEKTISVHRPTFYANRFWSFMKDFVFRIAPRKSTGVHLGAILYGDAYGKKQEQILNRQDSIIKAKRSGQRSLRVVSDTAIFISYKNISSQQLITSIQLGLKQIISGLAINPELDLLISDFGTNEEIEFSRENSVYVNPEHIPEFAFKTYAPFIFHYFKALYSVNLNDYQNSIISQPLRDVGYLHHPATSSSLFYFTGDDKYIIKSVQHKESKFLQKLLSGYYLNIKQNPNTLLPKFFGHYRYKCLSMKYAIYTSGPRKIKVRRFVVMNNLIPSNIKIHEKYDLKGSTNNRKASDDARKKPVPTLKDLDFSANHPDGLWLESNDYNALVNNLKSDVSVLENHKIINYSLLIAVHKLDNTESGEKSNPEKQTSDSTIKGIRAKNAAGEELILYIGIIDILQKYDSTKQIEHFYKSMVEEKNGISVKSPDIYAKRFLEFMFLSVFKHDKIGSYKLFN